MGTVNFISLAATTQLAGSFALAAVTTVLVVWGAARIYKRTILNKGSVTKWSQVLRRG
ncbi:hypothetical protein [Corynebacterium coyleae]|uniref:Uncharacterized protein n=1 Tax=Corynebacterium coyleae TaxID=53374 RepID=A0ABX8KVU6_9CORY|nr:hypothetical protein [Corynebacterium coyleae]QXB17923.1 hypothetical protein I6L55_08475 [Corynebacterium coyleae]